MTRNKDLPFTKLDDEDGIWFLKNEPPFYVEWKIDGEDLLVCRTLQGDLYAINRYGTQYTDLPFLKDVEWPIGSIIRGEMFNPLGGGNVYEVRKSLKPPENENLYFAAHDIIYHEGKDIRMLKLSERKAILDAALKIPNPAALSRVEILRGIVVNTKEEALNHFQEIVEEHDAEGIVVKPLGSIYKNDAWLKLKIWKTMDILLTAARKDSIHDGIPWTFRMEAFIDGKLTYIGDVSSYEDHSKEDRKEIMRPIGREDKDWLWFGVPVVAEIRCHEVLRLNGVRLREPVIRKIREDKPIEECILQ